MRLVLGATWGRWAERRCGRVCALQRQAKGTVTPRPTKLRARRPQNVVSYEVFFRGVSVPL
nr:MAG TPA: hypothetical protein [Caudoviricetes sp.]